MLYRFKILISLFVILLISFPAITQAEYSEPCSTIEIFTRNGCPHCAAADAYLETLNNEHPEIEIIPRDIDSAPENMSRFIELNMRFSIEQPGVPFLLVCEQYLIGFDNESTTGTTIKRMLGLENKSNAISKTHDIDTPIFGTVSVDKIGLPLFTIIIGLVDGFNPCAMWVLLVLLSILINLRDRKRILMIAGTFVFISGAIYFIFMAAWLNMFLIIGFSRILQIIVGLLAILIGSIHIKDYFAFKQGVSLSISDSAKPSLYNRMRNIIYAKNMIATFIAVIVLAVLVNLIELLCTAGLPALYTQILTLQQLSTFQYYLYLLLYNIAYMFDDALMVGLVVFSMSKQRLGEQQGRWLKLLSGGIIFILGALLIFKPSLLI
jgi:glutaredoxin